MSYTIDKTITSESMKDRKTTRKKQSDSSKDPDGRPVSDINLSISLKLIEYAELLEHQGADGFRSKAYRHAAETIAALHESVDAILQRDGRKGLIALPGIGRGIAAAIAELVLTGRWAQLERLHGEVTPDTLFQSIPGIGPQLSKILIEKAHLETLEDLEVAVHRADTHIKGFGPGRKEAIAAVLAKRLGRPVSSVVQSEIELPSIDLLLQVDEMYRSRAAKGSLRKIAPRRFNPNSKAWLPVMHANHDQWHFTVLFSNTAHAHQYKKTDDWVVIYFQADGHPEGRCTVVTETQGRFKGRRVVRGHESKLTEAT